MTSGTLSPLSSFGNELRLPFEVQVENPHVIGPEQVQYMRNTTLIAVVISPTDVVFL